MTDKDREAIENLGVDVRCLTAMIKHLIEAIRDLAKAVDK